MGNRVFFRWKGKGIPGSYSGYRGKEQNDRAWSPGFAHG